MSKLESYAIKQPLFGWAKGEVITYNSEWSEWTRKKTGICYDTRGSIAEGEIVMMLNYLRMNHLTSILVKVNPPDGQ